MVTYTQSNYFLNNQSYLFIFSVNGVVKGNSEVNKMDVDQNEVTKTNGVTDNPMDDDEDDNKLLIDTEDSGADVESVNEDELLKSDNDSPDQVVNGNVDQSEATTKPIKFNKEKSDSQQSKTEKSADSSNAMEVDSVNNKNQVKTETSDRDGAITDGNNVCSS